MKRILLAFVFLVGSVAGAMAACVSPAVMHDFPGTAFNMSLATVPDGNCGSNVALPTWAGGTLGAMATYGTSPGAVLVPGVNAFITNAPAVTNAGTFAVQLTGATNNVNNIAGTVSLPTGASTSANQGTTADVPCTVPTSATACSEIAIAKAIANAAAAAVPAGTNTIGTVGQLPYPVGAVPITASATGTTAATTATLAASASIKTYICGYSIRANATANTNVTDTVTGVVSGTMSSALWVPANTAGLGVDEQIFAPCIPSSAINTAIAVVSGAPGTGGVVTVKAWGYQL